MNLFDAILLGILQGLTEFLPISSSGHLVLGQELLKIAQTNDITFEVFVHFGTFLSVVFMFWRDLFLIFQSVFKGITNPLKIPELYKSDDYFRLAVFIIIGSIPAGVVGILFSDEIGLLFNDPKFVAVMLLITGLILYLTKFTNPKDNIKVGFFSAILIGLAQAVAIVPGISRSGITISTALYSGVSREYSAKFSFLLALPAIFGATILETKNLYINQPTPETILILFTGTILAAISGYVAIKLVLGILQKKKFSWFSYYCFIAGILGLLFIGQ